MSLCNVRWLYVYIAVPYVSTRELHMKEMKIKINGELENKGTTFLKPLVLQTKEAADN